MTRTIFLVTFHFYMCAGHALHTRARVQHTCATLVYHTQTKVQSEVQLRGETASLHEDVKSALVSKLMCKLF